MRGIGKWRVEEASPTGRVVGKTQPEVVKCLTVGVRHPGNVLRVPDGAADNGSHLAWAHRQLM